VVRAILAKLWLKVVLQGRAREGGGGSRGIKSKSFAFLAHDVLSCNRSSVRRTAPTSVDLLASSHEGESCGSAGTNGEAHLPGMQHPPYSPGHHQTTQIEAARMSAGLMGACRAAFPSSPRGRSPPERTLSTPGEARGLGVHARAPSPPKIVHEPESRLEGPRAVGSGGVHLGVHPLPRSGQGLEGVPQEGGADGSEEAGGVPGATHTPQTAHQEVQSLPPEEKVLGPGEREGGEVNSEARPCHPPEAWEVGKGEGAGVRQAEVESPELWDSLPRATVATEAEGGPDREEEEAVRLPPAEGLSRPWDALLGDTAPETEEDPQKEEAGAYGEGSGRGESLLVELGLSPDPKPNGNEERSPPPPKQEPAQLPPPENRPEVWPEGSQWGRPPADSRAGWSDTRVGLSEPNPSLLETSLRSSARSWQSSQTLQNLAGKPPPGWNALKPEDFQRDEAGGGGYEGARPDRWGEVPSRNTAGRGRECWGEPTLDRGQGLEPGPRSGSRVEQRLPQRSANPVENSASNPRTPTRRAADGWGSPSDGGTLPIGANAGNHRSTAVPQATDRFPVGGAARVHRFGDITHMKALQDAIRDAGNYLHGSLSCWIGLPMEKCLEGINLWRGWGLRR